MPARRVFEAVLWILHTGAQWSFLPQCYPNYKTVHRRFQAWVRTGVLEDVLKDLADEAKQRGLFDGSKAYVDASFARAKGGDAGVGNTKAGKGVKIMAIVDRCGLPLSLSTHPANPHESTLVQLSLDLAFAEDEPANLIGDKAWPRAGCHEGPTKAN